MGLLVHILGQIVGGGGGAGAAYELAAQLAAIGIQARAMRQNTKYRPARVRDIGCLQRTKASGGERQ